MKLLPISILILSIATSALAQTTASFEQTNFGTATFLNNSGAAGAFHDGNISLPNEYDTQFQFWSGWSLSKVTDNTTEGFGNQYSCIPGKGAQNSAAYAVGYAFDPAVVRLTGAASGKTVQGFYLTNNTYTYFSMLKGDAFAKRFGGATGNDPDFLKLTIRKYQNGQFGSDSIEFYLADYRFADNTKDYLVTDWSFVNLSSLGNADSLHIEMTSSDVGAFGINTPTYFCMDHMTTLDGAVASFEAEQAQTLSIWPNPCVDVLQIRGLTQGEASAAIIDQTGREVMVQTNTDGQNLQTSDLARGIYLVRVRQGNEVYLAKFVKQ